MVGGLLLFFFALVALNSPRMRSCDAAGAIHLAQSQWKRKKVGGEGGGGEAVFLLGILECCRLVLRNATTTGCPSSNDIISRHHLL